MAELNEFADDAQIAVARAVGDRSLKAPRAMAARYLPVRDRIEIDLASGWSVQVPRAFSARLAEAPQRGQALSFASPRRGFAACPALCASSSPA